MYDIGGENVGALTVKGFPIVHTVYCRLAIDIATLPTIIITDEQLLSANIKRPLIFKFIPH